MAPRLLLIPEGVMLVVSIISILSLPVQTRSDWMALLALITATLFGVKARSGSLVFLRLEAAVAS